MNFYMLVEGSKTEMRIYPEWFKVLLPEYTRVATMDKIKENTYVLESGFGIPNIYNHIDRAAKTLCLSNEVDYFIICIDLEEELESYINQRIDDILNAYQGQLQAKKILILQKQCIETWFLGNAAIYPKEISSYFQEYDNFYNVAINDPEEMLKPENFKGSIGNYHLRYLAALFRCNKMNYGKSSTKMVEKAEYLQELIKRTTHSKHLSRFNELLETCKLLKHS